MRNTTQVIRLLGVCTRDENRLMVILELAARGDLKSFLRDCRPVEVSSIIMNHLVAIVNSCVPGHGVCAEHGRSCQDGDGRGQWNGISVNI